MALIEDDCASNTYVETVDSLIVCEAEVVVCGVEPFVDGLDAFLGDPCTRPLQIETFGSISNFYIGVMPTDIRA